MLLVLVLMLVCRVVVGGVVVGAVAAGCWYVGGVLLDDVDDLLFVVGCCWMY